VTCDDFAQSIADANPGSALTVRLEAFKRWYGQAGTPRLRARGSWDAGARRYTLTLSQQPPAVAASLRAQGTAAGEPFVIPVRAALIRADGGEAAAERVLVLDGAEQTFVFEDVDAGEHGDAGGPAPVPSLLRDFSAPVILDDDLGDAELLTLLAHDTDAFTRWEAGQRLALGRLLSALQPGADSAVPTLDDAFVEAMRTVLRHPSLDPAFKDLVLGLPSEIYIAEQLAPVDPQRIHAVREHFRAQLAERLHADWLWAWEDHQVNEGYSPTADQAARRTLANHALAMLCLHAERQGDPTWAGRAYQRVKDAGNMTDRVGALQALLASHAELAQPALERFHAAAAGDALVVDKWFALQARAPEPVAGLHHAAPGSVFARARALLKHPDFSLKNPNRARSLLGGLFMGNPAAFHRGDAAGYVLWADKLIELDAINPQVASRLARAMDRWTVLAEPWRSAAELALQRLAARSDLSDDLREVVGRALQVD
jgi:aminopeptidase N